MCYVDDLDAPVLDRADYHHAARARRMRDGEPITVADGFGRWLPAELAKAPVIGDERPFEEPQPPTPVIVGVALIKALDVAVQKLVEVGADEIWLVESERCVVRWAPSDVDRKLDRLRAIVREAGTQSRRARLPAIAAPAPVEAMAYRPGVVLAEPGGAPLRDAEAVLVGPEGGWSPAELAGASATVDLGPFVLRAETAAIVAGVTLAAAHR